MNLLDEIAEAVDNYATVVEYKNIYTSYQDAWLTRIRELRFIYFCNTGIMLELPND